MDFGCQGCSHQNIKQTQTSSEIDEGRNAARLEGPEQLLFESMDLPQEDKGADSNSEAILQEEWETSQTTRDQLEQRFQRGDRDSEVVNVKQAFKELLMNMPLEEPLSERSKYRS